MYQRILVATDGSDLSKRAVEHALALAEMAKAEVIALKVVPCYPDVYFEGGMTINTEDLQRAEQQWNDEAQAIVQAIQTEGQRRHLNVKPLTVKSDFVAESIINTAKQQHCDLIVMASHGRKGIQRVLLGSETQQVLTHSHTPVLVLR